jgi:hypothetical protein
MASFFHKTSKHFNIVYGPISPETPDSIQVTDGTADFGICLDRADKWVDLISLHKDVSPGRRKK